MKLAVQQRPTACQLQLRDRLRRDGVNPVVEVLRLPLCCPSHIATSQSSPLSLCVGVNSTVPKHSFYSSQRSCRQVVRCRVSGNRGESCGVDGPTLCDSAVYFVGIGGSGLSALAAFALKEGCCVFGSDAVDSSQLQRLRALGISVHVGHAARHLDAFLACPAASKALVRSSAVPSSTPEVQRAQELGIPVLTRGQWLQRAAAAFDLLAVAGTHGKSTTTAMLAWALQRCPPPSGPVAAIVGANVPQFPSGGSILHSAGARTLVLEADEYDRCFLSLAPLLAVVTSVEWEHVDCFPDEAAVRDVFQQFAQQVQPHGTLIVCGDNAGSRALASAFSAAQPQPPTAQQPEGSGSTAVQRASWLDLREESRGVVSYGVGEGNDWRAIMLAPNPVGGTDYVAVFNNRPMARVSLRLPGLHNVQNSLAVLCACATLALCGAPTAGDADHVAAQRLERQQRAAAAAASVLAEFDGAARRFQLVGRAVDRRVLVIDDYAHHPTEVRASLQAARQRFDWQPLWVVFEPHTHGRLARLLDDFAPAFSAADRVIVTEVYAARKEEDRSVTGETLAASITGVPASYVETHDAVIERLVWEICARRPVDEDQQALPQNSWPSSWYLSQGATLDDIVIITMGAGIVTKLGPKLLNALSKSSRIVFSDSS